MQPSESLDFINDPSSQRVRPAPYGAEIERHLDMIIQLVGQEYKEKLLNMQRTLNEKEYEKNSLISEIKNLKERFAEQEIEQRKYHEQVANNQQRFHQLEKMLLEKDEDYHKLFTQHAYALNEDRNKESIVKKLQMELERYERENRYVKGDNIEKEKKVMELDEKVRFLIEKLHAMEKFLETKDRSILQIEQLLMDEKENVKKTETRLKDFEEEGYVLRGHIERIKRERDFVQDEMEKMRIRLANPQ